MTTAISKKVCLLGDYAVGKTSLVRRFVYDLFDDRYISTIGVKVSRKTVVVPRINDVVDLTIMLWDLDGSGEFDQVRASYLRGAAGAILVCDLTRAETLDRLKTYCENLYAVGRDALCVIAANKRDLADERQIAPEQVEAMAKGLNARYYLTSAKTGEEVEVLFRHLGRLLVTQA